jgi:hypothetical protein
MSAMLRVLVQARLALLLVVATAAAMQSLRRS